MTWERVRGKGGMHCRSRWGRPGADPAIVVAFLVDARQQLKSRTFTPLPVRERLIPKAGGGKLRRLRRRPH